MLTRLLLYSLNDTSPNQVNELPPPKGRFPILAPPSGVGVGLRGQFQLPRLYFYVKEWIKKLSLHLSIPQWLC